MAEATPEDVYWCDGIAVGSDQSVTIPPLPPQVTLSSPVGTGLHGTTLRGSGPELLRCAPPVL